MLVLDVTSFVISSVIMSFRELFLLFCTLTGQTFHRLAPSRIISNSDEDNDHEDNIEELDLSGAFEEVSSEDEEEETEEEEEEPCSNRLELECPVCLEVSHGNIYQVWPLTQFFLFPFCKKSAICLGPSINDPSSGKHYSL